MDFTFVTEYETYSVGWTTDAKKFFKSSPEDAMKLLTVSSSLVSLDQGKGYLFGLIENVPDIEYACIMKNNYHDVTNFNANTAIDSDYEIVYQVVSEKYEEDVNPSEYS